MNCQRFFSCLYLVLLASCSSIQSTESPVTGQADGLTYFMPKKDFVAVIKVEKENVKSVTFSSTASYPDLSKQYLLNYGSNALGKNTLDIGITESGLLTSGKSTTVSNVNDAFKNLAASIGIANTLAIDLKPTDQKCKDGEHTFIFTLPYTEMTSCGVKIAITAMRPSEDTIVKHTKSSATSYSGIFYRQDIPYLLQASTKENEVNVSTILFSPSESATHFLPISRTFFSGNDGSFTLREGVPNKFTQTTDGEIVALLKLPADILAAYFGAVGSVFSSFKDVDTKEADALAASLKLELEKKKHEDCMTALHSGDNDKVKELACKQ